MSRCGKQILTHYQISRLVPKEERVVKVTFRVNIPPGLNFAYIAGSFNKWNPKGNRLEYIQDSNYYTTTLDLSEGEIIEYKYTQGTWDTVETTLDQVDRANRRIEIRSSYSDSMQITDVVEKWKYNKVLYDLLDNLKLLNRSSPFSSKLTDVVQALGKTGSPLVIDPILQLMFNYPNYESRGFFQTALYDLVSNSSLNHLLIQLAVRAGTYEILMNAQLHGGTSYISLEKSESAVRELCNTESDLTSNLLHLICKTKNITVKLHSSSCVYCRYYDSLISFEHQRNIALNELSRRGNPPYNPDAYLPKS